MSDWLAGVEAQYSPAPTAPERKSTAPSNLGVKKTKKRIKTRADPVSTFTRVGHKTKTEGLEYLVYRLGRLHRICKSQGHPDRLFELATTVLLELSHDEPEPGDQKAAFVRRILDGESVNPAIYLAFQAFYTMGKLNKKPMLKEALEVARASFRAWPLPNWSSEDERKWGMAVTEEDAMVKVKEDESASGTAYDASSAVNARVFPEDFSGMGTASEEPSAESPAATRIKSESPDQGTGRGMAGGHLGRSRSSNAAAGAPVAQTTDPESDQREPGSVFGRTEHEGASIWDGPYPQPHTSLVPPPQDGWYYYGSFPPPCSCQAGTHHHHGAPSGVSKQ